MAAGPDKPRLVVEVGPYCATVMLVGENTQGASRGDGDIGCLVFVYRIEVQEERDFCRKLALNMVDIDQWSSGGSLNDVVCLVGQTTEGDQSRPASRILEG